MRTIQLEKLIQHLDFIQIHKGDELILTFYIPYPEHTLADKSILKYDISITNISEFIDYNNKYKWITKEYILRDMYRNPNLYTLTHCDEPTTRDIIKSDKYYKSIKTKQLLAPVRDADDVVIYRNNLNFKDFCTDFKPIDNKGN